MTINKRTVLFVENDPDFLDTRAEFLERSGYKVLKAYSLNEAYRLLDTNLIHLAIIDIRLVDDDDELDTSGMSLAKDLKYRNIPKLILTSFPTTDCVREALRIQDDGSPFAFDFLTKLDGPEKMILTVNQVITTKAHINWNLNIHWGKQGPFFFNHLTSLINVKQDCPTIIDLDSELDTLFRKLFYEYEQIILSRVLWQQNHRVALEVLASQKEHLESFVVTFGGAKEVKDELNSYNDNIPLQGTTTITNPVITAETQRFAATAWGFPQTDIDETLRFSDFYYRHSERQVCLVIDYLYQSTLDVWYQQNRSVEREMSLAKFMRERVGINPENLPSEEFRNRIQVLINEAVRFKIGNISNKSGRFDFQLAKGKKISCPDPIPFLYGDKIVQESAVLCVTIPGILDIDTILIDSNYKSWLTDFAQIQVAPIWQDFVSLETNIRFDLLGVYELFTLLDFDEQLLSTNRLNEKIRLSDVVKDCRKGLRSIQTIRQLAAQLVGNDLLSYYISLLFYSAQGLVVYDPEVQRTKREIVSLIHRLIFIAMLCKKISELQERPDEKSVLEEEKKQLRIDIQNQQVLVGAKKINLTQMEFELLQFLFRNANQLCTRANILEEVFQYEDATKKIGSSLINTTVARLRNKIEPCPGNQRFIKTVRGKGYILTPKPE